MSNNGQMAFTFCCPCGPTDAALMEWCGFKKGFTMHDWYERFYVGTWLDDGAIERCACAQHKEKH
jgi:hypothetical protein